VKVTNAVVLAGGLGTRLKSVIKDIPKPMAMVAGKPFLQHILDHLYNYGFKQIVLSVGYKSEIIQDFFKNEYRGILIKYAIEKKPLGTGGGIRLAGELFADEPYFIFNGDTLFRADLWSMEDVFFNQKSDLVLALKPMENCFRYGTVELNDDNKVITFNEKESTKKGLINGGVYLMNNTVFKNDTLSSSFSFEKEIMENSMDTLNIHGIISDEYFIDIGIPTDYEKAQHDFKQLNLTEFIQKIKSENWTLFLDRDGVINQRIPGNYVKYPKEFFFIKGSDTACTVFAQLFKIIVVITNQQGVGKNLMRAGLLDDVHDFMIKGIERVGGRIEKVYYCPELSKNDPKSRKPNIGMGYEAQHDFPYIDFNQSIIVGDSVSDIQFGNRLGMTTVFVETKTKKEVELAKKENIDFQFSNLFEFSKAINGKG
jgi:D-glycero-alpha-D-manno-heptose 1-phosphate guanylyltransferase